MSKSGPIVLVEDDLDDRDLFESAVEELNLGNKIVWFPETESAMEFLNTTNKRVFIIFCDINLPGKNGLEFKKDIDADPELRKKSIPFVFFSTNTNQKDVNEAYQEMVVQGFFKKPNGYVSLKAMLSNILMYWQTCKHPNSSDFM